ncbi:polymorphic toxin type 44 domain-containing protein [Fulvimarina sp. MAC8]|uniref:polymorphic toxin type 44 domain-containing protein n=1 Tax=Fulvimarina sp. MAC8 TaxID=3162874 RepID=UPI0032EFE3C2
MTTQHWLSFSIEQHSKYPISHSDFMDLNYYFDADGTLTATEALSEGPYTENNKRITAGVGRSYSRSKGEYHFKITEEQYNSEKFTLYIWMEPYGSAALSDKTNGNLLVGRLKLGVSSAKHKGSLILPPPSSQSADQQILFEFEVGDSVAQFIAQEMNRNKNAKATGEMRDVMNNRGIYAQQVGRPPLSEQHRRAIAESIFAHQTHADFHPAKAWYEELGTLVQLAYFGGGGQWDHKPIIYADWGSRNRLGNSGYVYYYDLWSNLHFGYIAAAAGLPLHRVIAGAGFAQKIDSGTGREMVAGIAGALWNPPNLRPDEEMKRYLFADAPEDRRAIINGYSLYDQEVSYRTIVNIVSQFPEKWLFAGEK